MPTATMPFRLTPTDLAQIDAIQTRYGLANRAAAVRYAIQTVAGRLKTAPKKSRKKSGAGT